jgi:flagellar biosynthesis chaperone FliJ
MSLESEMEQRLNDAAQALSEARRHADDAITELIQASEEYQRAAQHLVADLWVRIP